jgi:Zn-dependent peptidase ImmA (M78 family)
MYENLKAKAHELLEIFQNAADYTDTATLETILETNHFQIKVIDIEYACYLENIIFCGRKDEISYRHNLAHEIAHIYLHCTLFSLSHPPNYKNEAQAEAFAAFLLLPSPAFEEDLMNQMGDKALSDKYQAPLHLIKVRKRICRPELRRKMHNTEPDEF